jgi:hypothetical protein
MGHRGTYWRNIAASAFIFLTVQALIGATVEAIQGTRSSCSLSSFLGPPAPPSCGSPAPSAQTPATALPGCGPTGPTRPSVAGTPADTPFVVSTSWTPPSQKMKCPRNGVNSKVAPRRRCVPPHRCRAGAPSGRPPMGASEGVTPASRFARAPSRTKLSRTRFRTAPGPGSIRSP